MSNASRRGRLSEVNAELARSNRELEEFAYVASHDLKSPLLVISGFLDLLQRTKAEQLDEDARRYIDAALRGSARMERLIDDLLAFSRVGRRDQDRTVVDLDAVARQLLADWEDAVREAGGTVHVGALPSVIGDATMLRQLLENLLSNCVKFRRADTDLVVEIIAERRLSEWMISVRDNGIGIALEHRGSVFTMFSRLQPASALPGSGIGLAICERVVHAHGGRIWAEEGIDGGAQVSFSLPVD
jgi:light-regulated signal transduction histidine kinase (bacteriophytochrome)